jgi:hypothetical protein
VFDLGNTQFSFPVYLGSLMAWGDCSGHNFSDRVPQDFFSGSGKLGPWQCVTAGKK